MPAIPRHRQPIINAAVTLFRRQGFSHTGLNDIVDSSGAAVAIAEVLDVIGDTCPECQPN